MKVAILGAGGVGRKRVQSLRPQDRLVAVVDLDQDRAAAMAATSGAAVGAHVATAIAAVPDIAIVATTHAALTALAFPLVEAGIPVLLEKPGASSFAELRRLQHLAERSNVPVHVGYNHRFHPGLQKARQLVDEGALGPLMMLRARYGHGGRPGYDREWRADPALSGGGELIDQGVHLLDLARWFLGDLTLQSALTPTLYWDMPVDDNAFLALTNTQGNVAWLHASSSEWKNLFSFELYGRDGKLHIEGLGGSYGVERLSWYRMLPQMGPPETTFWEYPGADTSWRLEFESVCRAIEQGTPMPVPLADGVAVLELVAQAYARGYSAPA